MEPTKEADPSQVGGAPGETKPDSSPAAAATAKDGEPTFVVKRHGQEVALTRDKALEYASKGFDYERKMIELKEQQTRLKDYEELDRRMRENPKLAEALRKAWENPDAILSARQAQPDDDDDGPVEGRQVPNPKIEALERELVALKQKDQQRDARDRSMSRQNAVSKAVESYEFLSTLSTGRQHVERRALDLLNSDPHMPLDEAVAAAVGEYEEIRREAQSKELERNSRVGAQRGIPPGVGTPVVSEVKRSPYTKHRIHGETLQRARETAKRFFPNLGG